MRRLQTLRPHNEVVPRPCEADERRPCELPVRQTVHQIGQTQEDGGEEIQQYEELPEIDQEGRDRTMKVEIRLDCVPPTATAQQKGAFVLGGHVRFFKKAKVRESEDFLAALLVRHVPPEPFACPVALTVRWVFPWRKTERKSVVKAGADVPHISRPDLDNLEKNLLDVLTRLRFWEDDSLVCEKHTSKWRGARPGIEIEIEEAGHGG